MILQQRKNSTKRENRLAVQAAQIHQPASPPAKSADPPPNRSITHYQLQKELPIFCTGTEIAAIRHRTECSHQEFTCDLKTYQHTTETEP
jgi:DNA-binding transcriptional regulator YiaG